MVCPASASASASVTVFSAFGLRFGATKLSSIARFGCGLVAFLVAAFGVVLVLVLRAMVVLRSMPCWAGWSCDVLL